MKLKVYGRRMDVERIHDEWIAFYVGLEGKRRKATDLIIPAHFEEDEVVSWVADLLHELATEENTSVEIIE